MSWVTLQWPWMLLLLGFLPLIRRRLQEAHKLNLQSVQALGGSVNDYEQRQKYRHRLLLWALGLMIVALARPGYAPERKSIDQSGRDVVFLVDVSRSMMAEDCYPSRLETAKQAIRDCLQSLNKDRVALVIYAGSSSILCPLTSDFDFLKYMLEQVRPNAVGFGGTLLLSAVEKVADQVFDDKRSVYQDLIILTDGEDHGPEMNQIAEVLNKSKSSVLIIGLGDSQTGSKIPIVTEEGEETSFKISGRFCFN